MPRGCHIITRPSWVIDSPVGRGEVGSSQGTFPLGSHRIENDRPKKSAVIRRRLVSKGGEKILNYSCIVQSFNLYNDLFFLVEKWFYHMYISSIQNFPFKLSLAKFYALSQISCSVLSDTLRPMDYSVPDLPVHHQLPELTQTHVHWVGDAIHVVPFSSRLQSFPASGSFPMSQFFASGGQSIGVSVSASVLPMNTQDWFPLGWTGWISLQFKEL